MKAETHHAWAVLWRSHNRLDGKREVLLGRFYGCNPELPAHVAGLRTMLFRTRDEARAWIRDHLGYIANSPDLRREPHGWKAPKTVRVRVRIEVAAE